MPSSTTTPPRGASHPTPNLTLLQKLLLTTTLLRLLPSLLHTLTKHILTTRSLSLRDLKLAAIRGATSNLTSLTLRDTQYLQRTTGETIARFAKGKGLRHEAVVLEVPGVHGKVEDGFPPCTLHFISPFRADTSDCTSPSHAKPKEGGKKTLLYIHGGGWTFPPSDSHPVFAWQTAQALTAEVTDAELCFLEYTLTPGAQYPAQLAQCCAALNYLVSNNTQDQEQDQDQDQGLGGRKPENVVIAGDSAGGNMVLGVLAHLISPHARIAPIHLRKGRQPSGPNKKDRPERKEFGNVAKLGGALAISPRCSNTYDFPSYQSNREKDILTVEAMQMFRLRLKAAKGEVWVTPLLEGREFWSKTTEVVGRVMVTCGGGEVFRDEIVEFAETRLGAGRESVSGVMGGGKSATLYVAEGEVHVQCVFDAGGGFESGKMLGAVLGWCRGVVRSS